MRILSRIVFAGLVSILSVNPALAERGKTCTFQHIGEQDFDKDWCRDGLRGHCYEAYVHIVQTIPHKLDWLYEKTITHGWRVFPGEEKSFSSQPGSRHKVHISWYRAKRDGYPDPLDKRFELLHLRNGSCEFWLNHGRLFH